MKTNLILSVLLLFLVGCAKEDEWELSLPAGNEFTLDSREHVLRLEIRSSSGWNVAAENTWYETEKITGSTGDSLIITVPINLSDANRDASIRIENVEGYTNIVLHQAGATGEYDFRLPIVFHILYNDASDEWQNIPTEYIQHTLNLTNAYYRNANGKSIDLKVQFTPAAYDPEGNLLAEAGIHRIHWPNSIKMDHKTFLQEKNKNMELLWNPNRYINVFVFEFMQENIAGVAYLPYTPQNHALDGLESNDELYTSLPDYKHGLVLNNIYMGASLDVPTGRQEVWPITLTHELGHYLGLFHVFTNGEDKTDYCDDTPDYDYEVYNNWLDDLGLTTWEQLLEHWPQPIERTSNDGVQFTSTNLMDYDYGLMERFTTDQRTRVRHVLTYSPLIPGPKIPVMRARGGEMRKKEGVIIQ